jgi:hypothetical protein
MATRFSNTLQNSNSTDALERAWAQFIFDTFVTSGLWVQTADTGQVTISTIAHATIANTYQGYHIYKMADTLQATKPCFLRMEFGASSASNLSPAFKITIGTGTDGAGNITGTLFGPAIVTTALNTTTGCNSYGSADTNRAQLLLFCQGTAHLVFSIERTHDATTGADTGDGFLLTYQDTTPGTLTAWINSAFGAQPPQERWTVVLSNNNPSTFGSNEGIGFPLHFKGYVQPVALGVIVVNAGDFVSGAQPQVTVYGTAHQYQIADGTSSQMSVATGGGATTNSGSTRRIGIRYE